MKYLVALILGVASLVVVAPAEAQTTIPTEDFYCIGTRDNGPWITNLLLFNHVRTHGDCTVDFGPLDRNPSGANRAAIEVTSQRTLDLTDSTVTLRPGQVGFDDTRRADIIRERLPLPAGITIKGGVVDGLAADQTGNGFDGISLEGCAFCAIDGVTIQNIRGLDTAGGPTESFAGTFLDCRGACVVKNSTVTATEARHAAATSSSFAVNGGKGVTIANITTEKVAGRGFGCWRTQNLIIRDSLSNQTVQHGIGLEECRGVTITNTWSVNGGNGGLQIRDTSGVRASGMVLSGNARYALGLREITPGTCVDNVVSGDAWAGSEGYIRTFNDAMCEVDVSGLVLH